MMVGKVLGHGFEIISKLDSHFYDSRKNRFWVSNPNLQCINSHFMSKECLIFMLASFEFLCQILDFSSEWSMASTNPLSKCVLVF